MKKIILLVTVLSVFFLCSNAVCQNKVVVIPLLKSKQTINNAFFEQNRTLENLDDWNTSYVGSHATYTKAGTTADVTLNGNGTGEADINFSKNFTDAKGIIGTINLASIDQASVGFGMYIGKLNGYDVHTNINFSEWDSQLNIRYKLRLKDSNNNTIETLAWGYMPATTGTTLGQDVRVGFVKFENAVHFYFNGEELIKWEPSETIAPREKTSVWFWEWVDQAIGSIASATFKDISIIN